MWVQYQTGKYVNTARISFADTSVNPPTITADGITVTVSAQYAPHIQAILARDNVTATPVALPPTVLSPEQAPGG